jgi:hypothetical protein
MIKLNKHKFSNGEEVEVVLTSDEINNFEQVQLEIIKPGLLNPKSVLGLGTTPESTGGKSFSVKFKTNSLIEDVYEIVLVRLHTPKKDSHYAENTQIDFLSGKEFNRLFFQVSNTSSREVTNESLTELILKTESNIEEKFNSGIVLSSDKSNNYSVFALIKGLKIGVRYRFEQFEIIPLNFGLEKIDELDAINFFLKNFTSTNLFFEYTMDVSQASQQELPVSVAHFPKIRASSNEEAYIFVENKVLHLLEIMSLSRGASGEIFDLIVIDLDSNAGTRYSKRNHYIGNLLTGGLSGENPETIEKYIHAIEVDDFKRFLTSLHKEVLKESNLGFKILRYWTILEVLAESKNFETGSRKTDLKDFDGKPLFELNEAGQPKVDDKTGENVIISVKNSIANVYNLLKLYQFGDAYTNLNNIKTWIALRDSVAHFGDITKYNNLRNDEAKYYAKEALKKIKDSPGHNPILFDLKEDVKLILKRELLN